MNEIESVGGQECNSLELLPSRLFVSMLDVYINTHQWGKLIQELDYLLRSWTAEEKKTVEARNSFMLSANSVSYGTKIDVKYPRLICC